jgi:hypothetical protein
MQNKNPIIPIAATPSSFRLSLVAHETQGSRED